MPPLLSSFVCNHNAVGNQYFEDRGYGWWGGFSVWSQYVLSDANPLGYGSCTEHGHGGRFSDAFLLECLNCHIFNRISIGKSMLEQCDRLSKNLVGNIFSLQHAKYLFWPPLEPASRPPTAVQTLDTAGQRAANSCDEKHSGSVTSKSNWRLEAMYVCEKSIVCGKMMLRMLASWSGGQVVAVAS